MKSGALTIYKIDYSLFRIQANPRGDGPKLKYVLKRARHLAREDNKVLIWSSFVRNVEYIAERLADIGAVYIHGKVETGDEDDDETREGKIRLFHNEPTIRLMVAKDEQVRHYRNCGAAY